MDGENIDQASDGKNPEHLLLRRGQQQVTPCVPGVLAPAHEGRHAAGIHELDACQINDDLRLLGRNCRKRSRDTHGIQYVEHPAQRDDNAAVAFPGIQNHAGHGNAFLRQQQGGVLTQRQGNRIHHK
jgi:hypothetical protein